MSSPIDYIFVKPLDKGVVTIVNILTSSEANIEFLMRNSMLAPLMNCVNIDNIIDLPPNTKLVLVLRYTLSSLLSDVCYTLPWSITIVYVKNVVRISPPLMNY